MKKEKQKIYLLGALLGLLAVVSAIATTQLLGKTNFLGTSTTFVRAAGLIEQIFIPDIAQEVPLYAKLKLSFDWQFMLVIGIGIGSFLSALVSKTFKMELIPTIWRERFGSSILKRSVLGFLGGVLAIYGARLADGCPSGHGLSGTMQLTLSSFVALFFFFGMGILASHLIYARRKK